MKISPLAPPDGFPHLPQIDGLRLATAAAGVKAPGRDDVLLAELAPGAVIAGTLTRSATRSSAVEWCAEQLGRATGETIGILVNSGNSNAFTGKIGEAAMRATVEAAARALGTAPEQVFPASTGVIGEPLPAEKVTAVLDDAAARLAAPDAAGWEAAARAIMTTDTFPKGASRICANGVKIAGFAKGSGMIAPDMATMLVYIFTDANIGQADLRGLVRDGCDASFNRITVDSDTSTSDTLLVGATRQGPEPGPDFAEALEAVMRELAQLVVRDGEGASKFVTVAVTGAASDADAQKVARAIADSPLVKTAIAGEDANWGRVVMAVGKSGAKADRDLLSIHFGNVLVAERGWVAEDYSEEQGAAYMKRPEIEIRVDLGLDDGRAVIWTCDLTHDYIRINADYRS